MRSNRGIPSFSLYGETPAAGQVESLHIEDIQSRSRKYLWRIDTHRHLNLSQCILLTVGTVAAVLDDGQADLTAPALLIVPPGTVHSFRFRADTQGFVLTVDLDRLLSVAGAAHHRPIQALFSSPKALDLRADPALAVRAAQLLEQLMTEFKLADRVLAPVGGWLACSVLWLLALETAADHAGREPTNRADLERLRRFRSLIESNYLRHWPVKRFAAQLALSETSLNRLCRRLVGATAFDLVQQRLALEARRRLVYGAGPIGAIAAELGFKDPAYFGRFFRRHSGMSPDAFRRRQIGGKVPG